MWGTVHRGIPVTVRTFQCPSCSSPLWFDNDRCIDCGVEVAYDVISDEFTTGRSPCANRTTVEHCNWVRHVDDWCRSCALDIDHSPAELRRPFQSAKRRTLRRLHRLGIDVSTSNPALRFDLRPSTDAEPVTTGHADGLITLDTAEAEPAHREEIRVDLGEPYRTPLGHVRHELGHWWWQAAIDDRFDSDAFRSMFGDERDDYTAALQRHYGSPDDGSWHDTHVSYYAASHPWEDFAESFAHVLHITDTLETAETHDVLQLPADDSFSVRYPTWVELTVTLNELNRSMGAADPYPFVVPPPAIRKFEFIHRSLTTSEPVGSGQS